jgi:hypothetical protein
MDARQPDPARVVAAIDSLDATGALWCTSERQRAERVRVAKARGRTEFIVHRGPVAGSAEHPYCQIEIERVRVVGVTYVGRRWQHGTVARTVPAVAWKTAHLPRPIRCTVSRPAHGQRPATGATAYAGPLCAHDPSVARAFGNAGGVDGGGGCCEGGARTAVRPGATAGANDDADAGADAGGGALSMVCRLRPLRHHLLGERMRAPSGSDSWRGVFMRRLADSRLRRLADSQTRRLRGGDACSPARGEKDAGVGRFLWFDPATASSDRT